MAMNPTDLKKGTLFTLDGEPYQVLEYRQKVVGRGSSVVTVRSRNLRDGKIAEKSFKGSEDIQPADIESKNATFLYNDANTYFFMDPSTYEQYELDRDLVGDSAGYLTEDQKVSVLMFEGRPISLDMPKNVWLKVEYTEPAVKGDTSSSITKEARLETGLTVRVPVFIKNDDVISVDTESGEYRERQK